MQHINLRYAFRYIIGIFSILALAAFDGAPGPTSEAKMHISITIPPRVEVNQEDTTGDNPVTTNLQDPEIKIVSEVSCGTDCLTQIIIVSPSLE